MQNLFEKRRKIESEIEHQIKMIHALNQAKNSINVAHQGIKDLCEEGFELMQEERNEKHKENTSEINYNCIECHETCIFDTNRVAYAIKSVLTLSLYHWISEKSLCARCNHSNSYHKYENRWRFTGLGSLAKTILTGIEEDLFSTHEKYVVKKDKAKIVQEKIEENIKLVANLSVEIEQLGVISVTFDSYLSHLDYLIGIEKGKEKPELRELEKQKTKYEEIKAQLRKKRVL